MDRNHIFNLTNVTLEEPISMNDESTTPNVEIKYKSLIMPKIIKVDDTDNTWLYEQPPMTLLPPHTRRITKTINLL